MNKKNWLIVTILAFAMLSSSMVGVFGAKKETTSYLLAATFDNVAGPDRYFGITIPGGQEVSDKWFVKQFESVKLVTLNIGGSLEEIAPGAGIYQMVGGTTYVFDAMNPSGADFTYEALQFQKGDNVNPEPGDPIYSLINIKIWTTLTFLPESGIEGTIEYQLDIAYHFDPPGTFAGFDLTLKGHGTGDLKGAIFDAVGGPLIMHGGTVTPATHDGIVRGWP